MSDRWLPWRIVGDWTGVEEWRAEMGTIGSETGRIGSQTLMVTGYSAVCVLFIAL